MNHRYYEELFFSMQDTQSTTLTAEQLVELNSHIEGCQSCQLMTDSWREADNALRQIPAAVPVPGFTERWRTRLETDRQHVFGRQTLLVFGFCLAAILFLSVLLALLVWPWAKTPDLIVWYWLSRIFNLLTLAGGIRDNMSVFIGTLTGVIPWGGWVLLAGFACQLAVLWLVTIRILTKSQRVVS